MRRQARQHRQNNYNAVDDDEPDSGNIDLHRGYGKPKIKAIVVFDSDDENLSDYVKTRLLVSRMLALKKYDEKWG